MFDDQTNVKYNNLSFIEHKFHILVAYLHELHFA